MRIRLATPRDLDALERVYDSARAYMLQTGNLTQWAHGEPSREELTEAIDRDMLFVGVADEKGANISVGGAGTTAHAPAVTDTTVAPAEMSTGNGGSAAPTSTTASNETGLPHCAFVLLRTEEPTYRRIHGGSWLNDEPYYTLHRVASDGQLCGVVSAAVSFAAAQARTAGVRNLRIDTHADNHPMQRALERAGFTRCGTIRIADGSPRIAFQLVLE